MRTLQEHAQRVRRWGYVSCALGAPAVLLAAYFVLAALWSVLIGGGSPARVRSLLLILPLLCIPAAPAFLGRRMVREANRFEQEITGPDLVPEWRLTCPPFPSPALAVLRRAALTLVLPLLVLIVPLSILFTAGYRHRTQSYLQAARASLEELVVAQERHRRETLSYSGDFGELNYKPFDNVVVELSADGGGWAAVCRTDHPRLGCAAYAGTVSEVPSTPGGSRPAIPGLVVCDRGTGR